MDEPSDNGLDFDFMDELFLDGCWVETNIGEDVLIPNSFISNSSSPWANKDSEAQAKDSPHENPSESLQCDSQESSRRIRISPKSTFSVTDRLMKALSSIEQTMKERNVLIQIWVPENRNGKRVLSIHQDLFTLDPTSWKLANYREVSSKYHFPTEEDTQCFSGLPGRVFLRKIPEWTPDVRLFKSDEYPRVNYAQQCEVSGSLGLPVFEQGSMNCLGVIEVVTTEQKMKYHPELEIVCKALEAVDLRSEALTITNAKTPNIDCLHGAALPEIKELLNIACNSHNLPLAQTWVSCIHHHKDSSCHTFENYADCVSTIDQACFVLDPKIQPFHEACSDHHILKGQGLPGGAFLTNQPCFSSDITSFTKTQYPLAHHAKLFRMRAAVAIRLRCLYSQRADFVLEFFLPLDCHDPDDQKGLLTSLSNVIRRFCHSLRVVTNEELEEERKELEKKELERRELEKKEVERESVRRVEDEEKKVHKGEKAISLDVLRQYFAGSLKDAAKSLGVCPTTLKRICRRHGIQRWPSRKLKKVGHSLRNIQDAIQSTSGVVKINSFYNFPAISSIKQDHRPKSPVSQSNSSNHSCSSGSNAQPTTDANSVPSRSESFQDLATQSREGSMMKRVSSGLELKSQDLGGNARVSNSNSNSEEWCRVKVGYEGEKVRFRMPEKWRFRDLKEEIWRRFGFEKERKCDLKYLDDDSEWVLLTCDADLSECVDICKSANGSSIRMMVVQSRNPVTS